MKTNNLKGEAHTPTPRKQGDGQAMREFAAMLPDPKERPRDRSRVDDAGIMPAFQQDMSNVPHSLKRSPADLENLRTCGVVIPASEVVKGEWHAWSRLKRPSSNFAKRKTEFTGRIGLTHPKTGDMLIAEYNGPRDPKEYFAFIVRACNSHAQLVQSNRELREALKVISECGSPEKAMLYDEEGVEGWRWTHPDGREWNEIGDHSDPAPAHPIIEITLQSISPCPPSTNT